MKHGLLILFIFCTCLAPLRLLAQNDSYRAEQARQARIRVLHQQILGGYEQNKKVPPADPATQLEAIKELSEIVKTVRVDPHHTTPSQPPRTSVEAWYTFYEVLKGTQETLKPWALRGLQKSRSTEDALFIAKNVLSIQASPNLHDLGVQALEAILPDHLVKAPTGSYHDDISLVSTQERLDAKVVRALLDLHDSAAPELSLRIQRLLQLPEVTLSVIEGSSIPLQEQVNLCRRLDALNKNKPMSLRISEFLRAESGSPYSLSYYSRIDAALLLLKVYSLRTPEIIGILTNSVSRTTAGSGTVVAELEAAGIRQLRYLKALLESSREHLYYGDYSPVEQSVSALDSWQAEVGDTRFKELLEIVLRAELNGRYPSGSTVHQAIRRLGRLGGLSNDVLEAIVRQWPNLTFEMSSWCDSERDRGNHTGDSNLRKVLAQSGVRTEDIDLVANKLNIREALSYAARRAKETAHYRNTPSTPAQGRWGILEQVRRMGQGFCQILK